MEAMAAWAAGLADWQAARQAELSGPDSWQGLVGLFWLEAAENVLGSDPQATVVLPALPPRAGCLRSTAEGWVWQAEGAAAQPLLSDRAGPPTQVEVGRYAFFLIERQGRVALRVRDRQWADSQVPKTVSCFPPAPAWRILASWTPLPAPQTLDVPNVSGEIATVTVDHAAVFTQGDETIRLLPMSVSPDEVFFVFRDRTSGPLTYGAGRFLKAAPAVDGVIELDFNRAYNPPCAFTPFATCPLPPAENWLPFAIEAGEKKPQA